MRIATVNMEIPYPLPSLPTEQDVQSLRRSITVNLINAAIGSAYPAGMSPAECAMFAPIQKQLLAEDTTQLTLSEADYAFLRDLFVGSKADAVRIKPEGAAWLVQWVNTLQYDVVWRDV